MGHYWRELVPLVLCIGFVAGVLGNLLASALLGTPALWHLHRKLNRQHREHLALLTAQHRERTAQAERHHRAVMSAFGTAPMGVTDTEGAS